MTKLGIQTNERMLETFARYCSPVEATLYFIIPRSLYTFIFYYKILLCWLLNQLFSFLLIGRLSKLLH